MSHYDAIIFDMDGTLWDASEPCARAWNLALIQILLQPPTITAADIRRVAGLPIESCVERLLPGCASAPAIQLIDDYERAVLNDSSGELYNGVADGIRQLSEAYPLFLISNCEGWYLQAFWRHSGLEAYFQDAACYGESNKQKSVMIAEMARRHKLSRAIYIGDTAADSASAGQAGVGFGHAAYGFERCEHNELAFDSFRTLVNFFLNQTGSLQQP